MDAGSCVDHLLLDSNGRGLEVRGGLISYVLVPLWEPGYPVPTGAVCPPSWKLLGTFLAIGLNKWALGRWGLGVVLSFPLTFHDFPVIIVLVLSRV